MDNKTLIEFVGLKVDKEVDEMCIAAEQCTLGELEIELKRASEDSVVLFEDGTHPGEFSSYRGFYRFIAIEKGNRCMVNELLTKVRVAIGNMYIGYKGGEYKMTRATPVWVSEYGEASGIGLIGIENLGDRIILKTGIVDNDM